ncbi:MAG: alanine--tRNA ligase [Alphaproteobacteria bacterium]
MASLNDIRATFLDYFAQNDHKVQASSPLVPLNDPTLMFVNAGMVPFKNVFTGQESFDAPRATSSQKCVRAGGKHNDLDNVGYTARHHTFFEMLGNFSFGDYFKEQAIHHAWKLITKDFDVSPARLTVTVYAEDDEAHDLWRKISGLPDDRIIRIGTSDNFWSMGDTGPCGPCSEIFFDHGDHIFGGPPGSPDEDGDRFVEIWNLVFMQFDQQADGTRLNLPKPSIDTGMGLERIAAVLQGTHDNYKTDLFQTLQNAVADVTGVAPSDDVASHRVIADHLRAASFLIADGVLPAKDGRGYVLRRIMRRAMRHGHLLGARDPIMHQLVPTLVREMGVAYGELGRAEALITETLKLEETRFRQTLDRGLKLLDEETADMAEGGALDGGIAFKLYDTYGFPLDLTEDALRPRGITVDQSGFDTAMEKQKAEARKAWSGSGDAATESLWFELRDTLGATEFLGYENESAEGVVTALVRDGAVVETLAQGEDGFVITNQTPFYGESGGQAGDKGEIKTLNGFAVVSDTLKKLGDLHVHAVTVQQGAIAKGDVADMSVDHANRTATRANHSATHLAHEALRRVLGPHVAQKGSLVNGDRLRFDFAHQKAMSDQEIAAVEAEVNARIRENTAAQTHLMTPEAAIEAGALALFGEKYGDEVRVLTMGRAPDADKAYSVELCGGTHVNRLGDIGLFKIVSEGAVASGVRRLEALTGEAARLHLAAQENLALEAASVLKAKPADLPARVQALAAEKKQLEQELAEAKKKLALVGDGASGGAPANEVEEVNGIKVIARSFDGLNPKDLRGLVDEAKTKLGQGIVAFVAVNDGKAAVATGVTDDLIDRISAVDLVRAGAQACGGKGGGGRPDMAQAGGPDGDKAHEAIAAMKALVAAL